MRPASLLLVLLAVVAAASQTRAQRYCYRALRATPGSPALTPPSSGPTPLSSARYLLPPSLPAPSSVGRSARSALRPVHVTSTAYTQGSGYWLTQLQYFCKNCIE